MTASGNNNFDPTSVSAPALPQKNPPWPNFLKHTTSAEFQPKTFKLISYVRREAGLPRKWKQPVPYQRGSCCAISAPRLTKGSAVAKISKTHCLCWPLFVAKVSKSLKWLELTRFRTPQQRKATLPYSFSQESF